MRARQPPVHVKLALVTDGARLAGEQILLIALLNKYPGGRLAGRKYSTENGGGGGGDKYEAEKKVTEQMLSTPGWEDAGEPVKRPRLSTEQYLRRWNGYNTTLIQRDEDQGQIPRSFSDLPEKYEDMPASGYVASKANRTETDAAARAAPPAIRRRSKPFESENHWKNSTPSFQVCQVTSNTTKHQTFLAG
ncbi:hypothetical protein CORC01_02206 [Colletotrichum orchidophilum]|uniref:Uncharacterized protein n=1 Tax=Colletotrichum orchidophilum TaxID=1209926 RepID=A0A1G4BM44_9PEZI|nr:uncharacterized protein CORC01_02206 [Colletotrichum orchidophilum]OHF02511.1 hypothetical protein CORC01_02206 [Colletotrichum orchidophilum]